MADPVFVRADGALWHHTSGRTLLSPAPGQETIDLTGIAALVWDVLGEAVSAADLAADLAAVFDQAPAAVEPQIEALLGDLLATGAVRRLA